MTKTNLQVRIPAEMERQITRLAPKSRSEFVREALREKIKQETYRHLEDDWIKALGDSPEDIKDIGRWLKAESWDES